MKVQKARLDALFKVMVIVNIFVALVSSVFIFTPINTKAAGSTKLVLTAISPTTFINIPNGTTVQVGLSAQNTNGVNVAEIVLNYDSTVLTAQSITASANILALNKSTSEPGKVTVDIANGVSSDFTPNINLVTFNFTVINNQVSQTNINVASTSTSGYPNVIAVDGFGALSLVFKAPTQPTYCGDSSIQTPNSAGVNEVCDNGTQNGVACTPTSGGTCNYCNSLCTQIITITAPEAPKCGDGIKQSGEVCDDGNTSNYDQCSKTCKNTCSTGKIWNGKRCVPVACRADYDRNGVVGVNDFRTFTQNYKKSNIDCSLDIVVKNSKCYLDSTDRALFSEVYIKNTSNRNVCK